ncbi:hypothetical protein EZV62_020740 [Acer yangbiense]|uniref:threonine--tRNA ligase n=1 Tax=Acer yangbiense TaxID=1000413 RepID=A0A5C7HER0_9ROSI|nr:hypothetical protein EZV62_020740 [Acer yangbiense]
MDTTSSLFFSSSSSSLFLSKPTSLSLRLPLKRFVSVSSQLRHGHAALSTSSTAASAVATESTQTPTLDGAEQTQKTVEETEKIVLPTNKSSEKLLRIRHSCAHVMAMAVQKLYPDAKVTIGPWIENGFYYDFDMEPLTDTDLKRIKKEMDRIIGRNLPLIREEVSRDEAERRITTIKEPYKMEILESIKEDPITIYHIGDEWWDLCAGPHVETTGNINKKAVELESVAGAYWRGDEKRPMLQRIYGTAWENEEQLKAYLHFKEEAKRRDHRRLGQDLDLFSIQDEAGGGLVFWHPKGSIVRHTIEDFWKKTHLEHGYDLLYTPHVAKAELWKISGHLDFYRENMYDQMNIEDELYQLRPMNCPYHILVYQRRRQSYRDFPIRVAELGTVYRYELSGSLHGLFRVRGFTQDDAHIFCLEDQIKVEIRGVLDLTEEILLKFGFDKYEVNLSTRPEKSVGGDDIWEKATSALRDALDDKGWNYQIDEGGGAFYGPKIDLKIEDALGRKWQCSTIQATRILPVTDTQLKFCCDVTDVDVCINCSKPLTRHGISVGSLGKFHLRLYFERYGDITLVIIPGKVLSCPVVEHLTAKDLKLGTLSWITFHLSSCSRVPMHLSHQKTDKDPLLILFGAELVYQRNLTTESRRNGQRVAFSTCLIGMIEVDESRGSSSNKGSSEFNCSSSVTSDEGCGARAPGVVALLRVKGLE